MPEKLREKDTNWADFGYNEGENLDNIKLSNFRCVGCKQSFIRGAFVGCGLVSDPDKSYYLELSVHNEKLAVEFIEFAKENQIFFKKRKRGSVTALYMKKADDIEDFLFLMGAQKEAFDIANDKIKKDFLNNANRVKNFETVNIQKTVDAAGKSISAVKKLIKSGKIKQLPESLITTAMLRIENETATLDELASLHDEKISKSGVSHRLAKIIEEAEK